MHVCKEKGRLWMAKLTAGLVCYLPQTMCSRAVPEARAERDNAPHKYQFRDIIMLLRYGAFYWAGPRSFISKHFHRTFRDITTLCGGLVRLGNTTCVQAIPMANYYSVSYGELDFCFFFFKRF